MSGTRLLFTPPSAETLAWIEEEIQPKKRLFTDGFWPPKLFLSAEDTANLVGWLLREVRDHRDALESVRPLTPHVRGCDEPDDPHCARCVLDSELARLTEALGA